MDRSVPCLGPHRRPRPRPQSISALGLSAGRSCHGGGLPGVPQADRGGNRPEDSVGGGPLQDSPRTDNPGVAASEPSRGRAVFSADLLAASQSCGTARSLLQKSWVPWNLGAQRSHGPATVAERTLRIAEPASSGAWSALLHHPTPAEYTSRTFSTGSLGAFVQRRVSRELSKTKEQPHPSRADPPRPSHLGRGHLPDRPADGCPATGARLVPQRMELHPRTNIVD